MPNGSWPKNWESTILKTQNSSCTILHHGAHVVSCCLGGSQEIFWLSPKSEYAEGVAIRGGNPLCWPNFGVNANFPNFPKHGLARLYQWDKVSEEAGDTLSRAVFSISSAQMHHQDLHSGLELKFTVELTDSLLKTKLEVLNNTDKPFTFTESQHAYFDVSDIGNVEISGMKGCTYIDRLAEDKKEACGEETFKIKKPTDIILIDHRAPLTIIDTGLSRKITIAKSGSQHSVIWNPYQAMPAEVTDMAADAFHHFVCVEPSNVQLSPTTVKSHESSTLEMMISVSNI